MLPQYKNFKAARENYELVTPSLYRISFLPPSAIQEGFELLPEHVLTVSGMWVDKNAAEVVQQQIGHIRTNHASDDPGDNTLNISISFSHPQ
jgi:hypothetical protein